ncbi:MAG: hypothetical protein N3D17_07340 [bacterium]|nr:hypothetical protein [bacterium]
MDNTETAFLIALLAPPKKNNISPFSQRLFLMDTNNLMPIILSYIILPARMKKSPLKNGGV